MSLLVSSGGGGGLITSSNITDASASGRTVLTGTASAARTALGISSESIGAAKTAAICPPAIPGSLSRFFAPEKPMSQKVIAWFGNSTVYAANELFTNLATYAAGGKILNGLTTTPVNLNGNGYVLNAGNIINFGHDGATCAEMTANSWVQDMAAKNPDLIIIRGPLINDVRNGAITLDTARSRISALLEKIILYAPWADIILTTENSLLTTDPGSRGLVTPQTAEAAQLYSRILHDAVVSFSGSYPYLTVIDVQSQVFGQNAPATSAYMLDQLHPNQSGRIAESDFIASILEYQHYKPNVSHLIKGYGDNLLAYSSDFTKYTKNGFPNISVNGNIITTPASGGGTLYQSFNATPGVTYTVSFYARKGSNLLPHYSIYDWTNKSFIAGTTDYSSLINTETFTRITRTFTAPAGCTNIGFYPCGSSLDTPNGTIEIDHVMVNVGGSALNFTPGIIQ